MNDGCDTTLNSLRRSKPAKDREDSRPEDEPIKPTSRSWEWIPATRTEPGRLVKYKEIKNEK